MAEIARDTLIDGRYRVVRRLGTGGMADVFLAEDQQLGRKVALKLLHRRFAEDPGFVERFRREAQSAAGLQHQNVVSVYDRGEFEDTYYIAMEYLPGRSLKQLIRDEAPLDPIRAIGAATAPPDCPESDRSRSTATATLGLSAGAKPMNHGCVSPSPAGPTEAVPVLPANWMPLPSCAGVPVPSSTTVRIIRLTSWAVFALITW